jgi:catechol-2,3-dioxygenase
MTVTQLHTGHVGLNVTDLDRSLRFYREVFGFEHLGGSGEDTEPGHRYARLGRDGRLVLTLWQQAADAHRRDLAGLHHLAFEVDSVEAVKEVEWSLKERGARFQYDGIVPHGPSRTSGGIFFEDPDGTRLEVYTPAIDGAAEPPVASAPTCGFF